jgi:hypothetical protein
MLEGKFEEMTAEKRWKRERVATQLGMWASSVDLSHEGSKELTSRGPDREEGEREGGMVKDDRVQGSGDEGETGG